MNELAQPLVAAEPPSVEAPTPRDEGALVAALRRGDERAFAELVDGHSSWMLRTARAYVRERSVAEDVVQEAWVSFLRAIGRFEGRSSLKTWLFAIVANAAKKRAAVESRTVPWSAFDDGESEAGEREPPADSFFDPSHPRWANCWTSTVRDWNALPSERLLSSELRHAIEGAADALPPMQRTVFMLRDVEGWSSADVCNALELSDSNERVLLHRARLRLRAALERYFDDDAGAKPC